MDIEDLLDKGQIRFERFIAQNIDYKLFLKSWRLRAGLNFSQVQVFKKIENFNHLFCIINLKKIFFILKLGVLKRT